MKRRIALVSLALIVAALGAAFPALLRDRDVERPTTQAPARASSAVQIPLLEQRVRDNPGDASALTRLANAYLQRARETADPSFYGLAETAVRRARDKQPDDVEALVVAGTLALSRHDFAGALAIGERARDAAPDLVAPYGVISDALVELGRYDEATAAAQAFVDRRPDFASYSRVSYIRELYGDLDGAIEAMERAVDAGSTLSQDVVWGRTLLGNLYLLKGDIAAAAGEYHRAAALLPDDPVTHAGLGRLAIAQGDFAEAESQLAAAVERRPLPEWVIALGDLLAIEGRQRQADQQYALVRAVEQLFAQNGVDTDVELALFDADHHAAPEETYATALAAHGRRPSVTAADALAWAAYKSGRIDEARARIAEAQRLGTRDPRIAYHAGVIAEAAGDHASAETSLRAAVATSASLSPSAAIAARRALQMVTAEAVR